jgi:hypothetical protein
MVAGVVAGDRVGVVPGPAVGERTGIGVVAHGGVRGVPVPGGGNRSRGAAGHRAGASVVVAERRELLRRTEVLVRELSGVATAGAVITCMVRCTDELVRLGVRAGLADAAEAMARARLVGPPEVIELP